jgi:Domain of unknown function (DUF2024)
MRVAVWDTYVQKKDGNTMHFDIIVPDTIKGAEIIYHYGKAYLESKNESDSNLDTDECQFCHIEEPSPDMIEHINKQGFYILEMEEIPAHLPANPSRREMILYLRAFHKQYRFADFKGKTLEDVQNLILNP